MRPAYSPLARDAFEIIQRLGAVSKQRLRDALGGAPSLAALDRALGELWSRLRITRVDYKEGEGGFWDALYRWAPEAVRQGVQMSVAEALSALISQYLDCMVAAEPAEIAEFFGRFVSQSRVTESIYALLAARELNFVPVGNKSSLQVTPSRAAPLPRARPAPKRHSAV